MENQGSKNLDKLIKHLNSDQVLLAKLITDLFGDNDGYSKYFQLSSLDLLLNFKIKLVVAICNEKVQQRLSIQENFKDYVINVEEFSESDKNKLNQLVISDESMNVILNNFLRNCKFEEINLEKFKIPEKEKEEEEEEIKVKLASDNDFIKICKFMYQMLYSERKLHSNQFNNGSDTMTPLRKILKKYKDFFEAISRIKNIKDYFNNLEKIECGDQTFQKLINEFGGALNIRNTIINSDVFTGKTEETKEKTKSEIQINIKDKVVNNDNNKIKMNLLKIRARIEEICEIVFSVGGLCLTALIALGILPWGALGIGICATLAFIGMTRFIATNSWTACHNRKYNKESLFDRHDRYELYAFFKMSIIPAIFLIAGAILTAFGATGILSLSLGLSLGIPLLGSFVVGVITFIAHRKTLISCDRSLSPKNKDNLWGLCMGIFAIIATATFLGLGFGGILALPTAIALAAPLCILAVGIGSLTLFAWGVNKYGPAKLKGWLKDYDDEISCLGFGYFKDKSHHPEQIDKSDNENDKLLINEE